MTDGLHTAFLGLGTNLGDRQQHLLTACRLIEERMGTITARSSFHQSEPWGFESDNAFLNAVVEVKTPLTPRQLLTASQQIEREMGRTRKSTDGIYHDRIIDIDILLYDHDVIDEPDLKIPHPLMQQRPFVMEPLNEILDQKRTPPV